MVRNAAVEAENKIRTIKASVQTTSGTHHPKTFMLIFAGNTSTQMADLVIRFKYEERNSMVVETM